jgi:GTP cyclohydrolase FolE2
MKKYRDPVNHKLHKEEVAPENFSAFMNELTDVPESEPLHDISIDEAGITAQQHILYTTDFTEGGAAEPLFCEIEMSVSLEGNRGIHMSRCEEVLFELKNRKDLSLIEIATAMAEKLREVQGSEKSYVTLNAQKALRKSTRITNSDTYDKIFLYAKSSVTSTSERRDVGLSAFNITACPCTKTYTKFTIVPKLIDLGLDLDLTQKIVDLTLSGTHTQRGTLSINIEDVSKDFKVESLYEVLDKSAHLVNELLKRPDEHDLVSRALARPQFTEDVVRETTVNLKKRLSQNIKSDSLVTIESVLHDSIHIHNVKTVIRRPFANL